MSAKLKLDNERIKNITIWGNHSATQYPDLDYAYVEGFNGGQGYSGNVPLKSLTADDKWVQGEFMKTVQQRGAAIIAARKLSSAASAASAACDHIRDWVLGTQEVICLIFLRFCFVYIVFLLFFLLML
jgi:malate dehydrogenase